MGIFDKKESNESFKLSDESAQEQLELLFDYYDIDIDDVDDEDTQSNMKMSIKKLKKAIRKGLLEIKEDDSLTVIQHLRKNLETTIIYGEVQGKAKVAMKSKGTNDFYGRIYAFMGSLSGLGADGIQQLKGVDLSIAECLGVIFLQV